MSSRCPASFAALEIGAAGLGQRHDFTVENGLPDVERGEGLGDGGKAMRPVVTAAGKELHVAISEERH